MTFSEKGLIRAMKAEYKDVGYTVAGTEFGYVITGSMWGVCIHEKAVPNSVKGVIVTHAGKLPGCGSAIHVQKGEVCNEIYELAVNRIETLAAKYREGVRMQILPTRLTIDGYRMWQMPKTLKMKMVDPEYQRILDILDHDAYLVDDAIFDETVYGSVFVCCETIEIEDEAVVDHLEELQWIPVEFEQGE